MNFVFVSPQFPANYWNFCDRLRRNGADVFGIGDAPYDSLDPRLRAVLGEYYRVDDGRDYDQMFRAMAFLSWKHGKIDWVESNNEFWLETDARLRTDFNVTTGVDTDAIVPFKRKSVQKACYAKAGVPCAKAVLVTTPAELDGAVSELGFPLIAKPDVGVGAGGAYRLGGPQDVERFRGSWGGEPYLLEQFVRAEAIWSYDAILDSRCEPLFENSCVFPPSIMDVAQRGLDLMYYARETPPELARLGRALAKAMGGARRFVHFEFFRLADDQPGLGRAGDFVGLEANMRPAGGFTPDMMGWAHGVDVYQIWADMVCFDERRASDAGVGGICVYAGRRDGHDYAHDDSEIQARFGGALRMHERIPDALADDLGNETYTALVEDEDSAMRFASFVQERAKPKPESEERTAQKSTSGARDGNERPQHPRHA
jgi:hypothetical protein